MKWDAVFFDFDGVILDSVNVKTKAFAAMFQSYGPEIENAVVRYHLENGGVDRYEKFKYFYENFLDKHLTQNEMEKLSKQFSQLVVNISYRRRPRMVRRISTCLYGLRN